MYKPDLFNENKYRVDRVVDLLLGNNVRDDERMPVARRIYDILIELDRMTLLGLKDSDGRDMDEATKNELFADMIVKFYEYDIRGNVNPNESAASTIMSYLDYTDKNDKDHYIRKICSDIQKFYYNTYGADNDSLRKIINIDKKRYVLGFILVGLIILAFLLVLFLVVVPGAKDNFASGVISRIKK